MSEQAIKLKQDLEKKLEHLCFIQDQTTLHVANEFYELRNKIDIDAEEVLERLRASKHEEESNEVVQVNKTREEFIGILRELEKRCLDQLPKANKSSSEEMYGHLKDKIVSFKDCSEDRLQKAHREIALEILEETDELEKRLLGEETLFYVSSKHINKLGCLIYIGEDRLRRQEVDILQKLEIKSKEHFFEELAGFLRKTLSINHIMRYMVDKNFMILSRVAYFLRFPPSAMQSKFIYIGKDEAEYAGYLPQNAATNSEFISYRFPSDMNYLAFILEIHRFSPSLDFLDFFASKDCTLYLSPLLKNLDILAYPSAAGLTSLHIFSWELESFDRDSFARCVNLSNLTINARVFRSLRFASELILPFQSLKSLNLLDYVPNLDQFIFSKFVNLSYLFIGGRIEKDKYCKLNGNDLKPFAAAPRLRNFDLTTFTIDYLDAYAFDDFKSLERVRFYVSHIGRVHEKAFERRTGEKIDFHY